MICFKQVQVNHKMDCESNFLHQLENFSFSFQITKPNFTMLSITLPTQTFATHATTRLPQTATFISLMNSSELIPTLSQGIHYQRSSKLFFYFYKEFQHMAFAVDNSSLLLDQDTNQFLV